MNESIKFSVSDPFGNYAKDDTGTMIAVVRDYTNRPSAVVRTDDGKYVMAPLPHVEAAPVVVVTA